MRSIGARLVLLYALSATATLAILFAIGYELLAGQLSHGLDQLNYAGFQQIKARLGADYKNLNSQILDQRIRETSEYSSALFYISVESPKTGVHFYSSNLHGRAIPDIKGKRTYDAVIAGVGETRVNEFLMPPFDVTIATPTRAMRESMRAYVKVCAALLAAMLLVSIGVGFWLSRVILRPIRLIAETANRIRSDNLSERIPTPDVNDEVADLVRLLNQMFERLEQAFDQVRRFSDEASHELKTPLSLVRLHAEKMLVDGGLSATHTEAVLVQIEELARLNQIIDELLFLSRANAQAIVFKLKPQSPAHLLEAFHQDATALAEHYGKRFTYSHEGEGKPAFEEKWVRQVLLNVLTNAVNASPPDGLISLRSTIADGVWRVSIEDQGPGLTRSQRQRIFERFVRFNVPKDGDRGSGLGLTICQSIIHLHSGRIFAEAASKGVGLRVTFEIPAADTRREAA
ncbi:MAG TPA: ATP-binding protein [Caulobacteraceae bacterium]